MHGDSVEKTLNKLADKIEKIAQSDGDFKTAVPALSIHRRNAPTAPVHCIYGIGLGVVIQGSKEVVLGGKSTSYRAGQILLTALELPVVSHVATATPSEPFLAMTVTIEPATVLQTVAGMSFPPLAKGFDFDPLTVKELDANVASSLLRLLHLNDEPHLIQHIAPLIQHEIIIRLLAGPFGDTLRHIALPGSPGQQISGAVAWLKQHFTQAISIDELASRASMSPSSFRHHFRIVTGMSPVQFIKKLRLQEARQHMLNSRSDAVSAAVKVGYESASQFSREYRREFGLSPLRDIRRLRDEKKE